MGYLEATVDKFVFRVVRDCRYSDADVWAKRVGQRVGTTDYPQHTTTQFCARTASTCSMKHR
jgi:hypothetical protein